MQKGFEAVNLHGTASGIIAVPVIGENGNWWIGNEDTGIAAQGAQGDQGVPGPQGSKGDKGETGCMGPQGPQGERGLTGAQGVKGDKGDQGPVGAMGPQGNQGAKGDKGETGFQGVKGDKGDTGLTGLQGIQGAKGDKGEIGAKGEAGPTGPQGSKGADADRGDIERLSAAVEKIVSDLGTYHARLILPNQYNLTSTITTLPLTGTSVEGVFKINADGSLTILKSGLYLVAYGIHGFVSSKGLIDVGLDGFDRVPTMTLANPSADGAQVNNSGSVCEFATAGTVIRLRASSQDSGGIYGNSQSSSTYLAIANLSAV